MADNISVTPGSGATVAMDEVVDGTLGTVKVQYVKIMGGALDDTTKAAVNANGLKVDASGVSLTAVGNVASAASDSGNPLKIGGTFQTSITPVTTGQRVDLAMTSRGNPRVINVASDGVTQQTMTTTGADGVSNSSLNALNVVTYPSGWNGATWDRLPGTTLGAYQIIRDAAGNARGANVNASNQLSVSLDGGTGSTVKVSDGTNTAAVKAASTAPAATDPSLVVAISPNSVNANGATTSANSAPIVPATDWVGTTALSKFGTGYYVTVAASATATVLQSSTGTTGDYISGVLVIPATTSPGNVLLLDNATSITVFAGGASSVSNLVPFFIPLGAVSRSGAWKITTGTNVSVIAIGKFS